MEEGPEGESRSTPRRSQRHLSNFRAFPRRADVDIGHKRVHSKLQTPSPVRPLLVVSSFTAVVGEEEPSLGSAMTPPPPYPL